jgi:Arc/MetJ-type ribon-helix-helix transcriptional regulator
MSNELEMLAEKARRSEDPEKQRLGDGIMLLVKERIRNSRSEMVRHARAKGQARRGHLRQALQTIKEWHDAGMVDDFPIGVLDTALDGERRGGPPS